jgi:hypothetical protein
MTVTAKYTDAPRTSIVVSGAVGGVNNPSGLAAGPLAARLLALGVTIADYAAPAPTADQVRAEARHRILAVYPEWAQANMTARAVELVKTLATGTLTADEQTELAALESAWAWIKSVRASSNTLEVMSPIPADYTADQRWP